MSQTIKPDFLYRDRIMTVSTRCFADRSCTSRCTLAFEHAKTLAMSA